MREAFADPKFSLVISSSLCVPIVALVGLTLLNMELDLTLATRIVGLQKSHLVSLLMLGGFLMLIPALVISAIPVVDRRRIKHRRQLATNAAFVAIISTVILLVLAAIIADQFPCWSGMPNCD